MKNVVITGAANGVGKAIANVLKEENMILIDIDENNLKQVAEKTKSKYYVCDIADDKQIINIIDDIKMNYEKIDCLINCAGMWISGDMSKIEEPLHKEMNELSRVKKVIDTNVFGTIAMIESIFPIMKKQGYGQIINVNSQSGVMCEPPFPIYNACPGLIKTDFYKRANNELPENIMNTGLIPEDVANTVKFVFDLPHEITIPSIEVRNIKNY